MLGHTFLHLSGIGPAGETSLWRAGIHCWEDFLSCRSLPLGSGRAALVRQGLEASIEARDRDDAAWFAARLRGANAWRLMPHFAAEAGYLDIETDGEYAPTVTSIALYHKGRVRTYVNGANLDDFPRDAAQVKVLVTYNGKSFDVPILERRFGMRLPGAHLDLRHVLASIGAKGGLKACERRFGLSRGELDGLDGFAAVLLWRLWEDTRDERVLRTLLAYNVADVLSLEILLAHAVDELLLGTPFAAACTMPIPSPHPNPYQPDPAVAAVVRDAMIQGKRCL